MSSGTLGKIYNDGEFILREGESGECMYVVQEGQVEVLKEYDGKLVPIAIRGEGEFFGEMALFEREVRRASVRARGNVRLLTIDRKNLLRRLQTDPSLAFRIIETMSQRIRELSDGVSYLSDAAAQHAQKTR